MRSISRKLVQLGFTAICFSVAFSSHAAPYTTLTLPVLNGNFRNSIDGATYDPLFPGDHVWNGVPFSLVEDASGNRFWGSITGSESLNIPAHVFGATTAYTIINTATGTFGANNGSVEFFGSEGAYHKVDLVQGTNVRDHFDGRFNNIINNTDALPAFNVGPGRARLDMQLYPLPTSFADETLTNVRFTPINVGVNGSPFIVAATVAAIPEPERYALMLAGLALLGFMARRTTS